MMEPFLGEIRIFSFDYAPQGWALGNGQLLPINQNQALFALLGTTYGGNGQTTFALPDLRGRSQIHFGDGHTLGESAGETSHALSISELPTHTHPWQGNAQNATSSVAIGNVVAASNKLYAAAGALTPLHPSSVPNSGGSQPHENMQPYLTVTFAIALNGIFPARD
ncbi:MAG: phage tail protein [Gaiellaceae bacterium]